MCYTNPSGWVMNIFYVKVSFIDNLVEKLDSSWIFRKNIWFSLPVPKIKFDLSQ